MRYYGNKLILNRIGQIYYQSQFVSSFKVLWCTAYNLSVCELFYKLIIVVYSCISYTGFAFSVFSLTHWCSCHIHHQIRCCVVLLSGTMWRYGCGKAVRFIKHNNIFQQYHQCILLTSSHCGGGLIVVCIAICIANLCSLNC